RVGGMVYAFDFSLWKRIGDQAVSDVLRKCAEYPSGFSVTTSRKREPFKRDHRVAAPVVEPVISRNHSPGFVTGCSRTRSLLVASCRKSYELICCQNQLTTKSRLGWFYGSGQQTVATLMFGGQGLFRTDCVDCRPGLR